MAIDMSKRVKVLHEDTGSDDSAWVVYETEDGDISVEYWDYPESYGDKHGAFTVYQIAVPDDVMAEEDWVDWEGVAKYTGMSMDELADAARSSNPVARASVYTQAIRGYESLENFDSAPMVLSEYEMSERWPNIVDEPYPEEFEYDKTGPDEKNPESGLRVALSMYDVEITEWTLTAPPDDEDAHEDWEAEPVLRLDVTVDVRKLLEPDAKHRGGYSGDAGQSYADVLQLPAEDQEQPIVAAAISWLASYGGDESMVAEVGE
jgi:hypothetical protein